MLMHTFINLGRRGRFILIVLLVSLSALAATAYTLWRLRAETINRQLETAAMMVRAFEDHLTQSFNVIERTLINVPEGSATADNLATALRHAPYLRSIGLLGEADMIAASSDVRNVGIRLSRGDYLPQALELVEVLRVGPLRDGRDFYEARPAGPETTSLSLNFIPVSRAIRLSGERWATAVASVNADYFLNFYANHVLPSVGSVKLLRYDGRLLLSTDELDQAGDLSTSTRILARLAESEVGRFEELATAGQPVLTAYRASRAYPFVLVVQLDKARALAGWRQEAVNTFGIVGAILLAALALASLYFVRFERVARKRDQAEESLRTLSRAVEQSPVSIVITDPDGNIQYVNPKFESITGYQQAEVIGKNPRVISSGEKSSAEYLSMWTTLKAGGVWQGEFHNRRKDGTLFWEFASISPVFNDEGVLLHFVAVKEDITERKLADEKIVELNRDFVSFLENTSDFIYFKDANSRFRFCSQTLANITHHASWRDMIGKHDLQVFPADTARLYHDEELPIFQEGRPLLNKVNPYYDVAGTLGWVSTNKWPLLDQSGKVVGLFGISRDITQQKQAEAKLQLAASVFTHSREGIMITAADGTIIEVNDAFSRITGYNREEATGRNPRMLSSGRQDKAFYEALWRDLLVKGHWYGEVWNRRKSGEDCAMMQTISAVRDANGDIQQYVSLFSDITTLKEHENQLEHMAHYDALTRLPNRVLLSDRLQQGMAQALRRGQQIAVAYLDLDGFKAINDSHGHEVGDQLLIALATRMRESLREGDTLSRLGGDEFVAVLADLADVAASVPMITRLLAAVAQPVHIGGVGGERVLQASASIGVTFFPQAEIVDAEQLLRQADQAMYQAKLAGKNRFHVFDAELDRSVRGHHESVEHIRRALTEREFVLHFQPKVNMRTGAVIGAEALIRWQHPQRGLLSPAAFLPVIEDHAMSVELGEWVIDSALRHRASWHDTGLDIPVSVNISARQLQQSDFVLRLRAILALHPELRPGDLELEVLETSALEDLVHVSQVILACQEIGVSFALDDFGTGYSSLTYLKRLPVAELKIDQSFVRDMLDDPDDLAILEGVIGLAGAFRRRIIAEGVETIEHGQMLLQLGCELAQGYGIAHPMPSHELAAWAASWRPDACWMKQSSVTRADLPLLFAIVEHRAWIAAIEHHLKGETQAQLRLDQHQCRFGQWLHSDGLSRYAALPACQKIEPLHQDVHVLANELLQLAKTSPQQALARLNELHELRDSLIFHLKSLL
jgi:diguanylate cyclase (GGDEF)-like protein/PAS domain S-box-containing protein